MGLVLDGKRFEDDLDCPGHGSGEVVLGFVDRDREPALTARELVERGLRSEAVLLDRRLQGPSGGDPAGF